MPLFTIAITVPVIVIVYQQILFFGVVLTISQGVFVFKTMILHI
jgi:hypothetical protein